VRSPVLPGAREFVDASVATGIPRGPLQIRRTSAGSTGISRASPSAALLEDLALHDSWTVYHPTTTCRIGSVVNPRLQVMEVERLRVADASVTPNVVSGNTNEASIMSGEKAAEMLAADHGVPPRELVGGATRVSRTMSSNVEHCSRGRLSSCLCC